MKSFGKKILIVLIVGIIIIQSSTIILAKSKEQMDLENEQSETEDKINQTQKEKENVEAEKTQTAKEVENLSSQISNYQSQIDELDGKISSLNTKITETETNLKKAEEDYTTQEDALKARLVAAYVAGDTSYLDVLLSSEGITDFISNYYLISQIAEADEAMLNKIQKQRQEIEKSKRELESSKSDLASSKTSKEMVTLQLQASKKEKDSKYAELDEKEKELQKQIEELDAHEKSIKNKIEEIKRSYVPPAPSNSNNGNNNSPGGGTSSYGFGWPVSNHSIGTDYGVSGKFWSLGYHTGVDFPVSAGTPVFSVGNGVVCDTGYNSAYGKFVEIYHGSNIYSFYAHASSVIVSYGQTVTKGQQIMLSGATGNVTRCSLTF